MICRSKKHIKNFSDINNCNNPNNFNTQTKLFRPINRTNNDNKILSSIKKKANFPDHSKRSWIYNCANSLIGGISNNGTSIKITDEKYKNLTMSRFPKKIIPYNTFASNGD